MIYRSLSRKKAIQKAIGATGIKLLPGRYAVIYIPVKTARSRFWYVQAIANCLDWNKRQEKFPSGWLFLLAG